MDCCDDRSACRRSTALFRLVVVISLLASSPLARSRQTITMVAPICASASAVAFPIPELAPVTMQIFPCILLFTVGMMRSFPCRAYKQYNENSACRKSSHCTVVRSMLFHSDDYFSLGMSCFKIPDSVCNVTQLETSIDDGFHLPGFKQLFPKHYILFFWFMTPLTHFLSPSL